MRSMPLSITSAEVAYEKRRCSSVPKASPGTHTTCASESSLEAICDAVDASFFGKYALTFW